MSISPLAVVSKNAEIGAGVRIDPFAIIHDGVILEPEVLSVPIAKLASPVPWLKHSVSQLVRDR